jgi:broad specificity phosphatase PhoE
LQGNADIPLDETGIAQARALAEDLAGKRVDAVYSSPLSRAYETALAIAAPHGLPVHKRSDLREIGVGIYTGHRASQITPAIRTAWATRPEFAMPSGTPDATNVPEPSYVSGMWFEGESLNMVAERSWRTGIRNLDEQHCGKTVAVVTHGGVIQIALTQVKELPVTHYRTFPVPNAAQTVLEFAPDGTVTVLPGW